MNTVRIPSLLAIVGMLATLVSISSGQTSRRVNVDRLEGIYLEPAASSVEKQASETLRQALQRLHGIDLPELDSSRGLTKRKAAIVLGRAALAEGLVTKRDLAEVGHGGFVVKCGGNRIAIAGFSVWGTYFGVVGFLEELGMRFYVPSISEAFVPQPERRTIEPFELFSRPTFKYRAGWSLLMREGTRSVGDPRNALDPELFTEEAGSDLWIDHTAGYLVPKALYYDQHPEYFAMGGDGRRIAKSDFTDYTTPLCLSNPNVTRVSIERALKWVEMNPDHDQARHVSTAPVVRGVCPPDFGGPSWPFSGRRWRTRSRSDRTGSTLLPRERPAGWPQFSPRSSNSRARAKVHSRCTLRSEISRASAIWLTERSLKKRKRVTSAARRSSFPSFSSASFNARKSSVSSSIPAFGVPSVTR